VGDTATTRWTVNFDTNKLADFILDRPEMLGGRFNPGGTVPPDEIEALLRGATVRAELWVANDTHYLRQLHFEQRFTIPPDATGSTPFGLSFLQLDLRLSLSGYNQPVNIVAPPGAVPFSLEGLARPGPGGQLAPVRQMPSGAAIATPIPRRLPRTGDLPLPLWPAAGLAVTLLAVGVGVRRRQASRRRSGAPD